MKYIVLTLFPKIFDNFIDTSIVSRAIKSSKIEIEIIDVRKFSKEKNFQVDDYGYGGDSGMVLMVQPWVEAIRKYKTENSTTILLSPRGITYNQDKARQIVIDNKQLILLCGHYEGFDERISNYIDLEISIGDYILTGGEIAAMAIIDSTARLVDGVIKKSSLAKESFDEYLLDHPVYTKPINFENLVVPEVLLSGNHKEIEKFRKSEQEKITKLKRPDLYAKYIEKNKEK